MTQRLTYDEAAAGSVESRPRIVVAIPVCNERERIRACLDALAGQSGLSRGSLGVVLLLNNCRDGTADIVRDVPDFPWPLRMFEVEEPAASAGWARRLAMEAAAEWLEAGAVVDGVLLTTDADSRVPADWVARNLAALAGGRDAVAGRLALDPTEAALLPAALHARGRSEAEYEALLTEIGARLDPEPGNRWPCHWSKSGATIAVTLEAYRLVGGMPDQPSGEDHAFIDALRAHDRIVRHAPEVEVVTSGRLDGRATGGVADTIRLRCNVPDSPCDDRLEPLRHALRRGLWRRRLRRLHATGDLAAIGWADALTIPPSAARAIAEARHFGRAYADIEAASPKLAYHPLRPSELPRQIKLARVFVMILRLLDREPASAARRADRLRSGRATGQSRTLPSSL